MNLLEKQISSKYVYNGKIINVRIDDAEIPNGEIKKREVVEHPGGVCVVPLTDKNEVLLVKQFRYPYSEIILEVPAGKRDKGSGETPLECGIRELKEETGAAAEDFIFLGELYPSPGYINEIVYMYLAKGLNFSEPEPDDDEFLELERLPLDTVVEMVMSNEIKDAKTQTAILKTKYLLDNGKI